MRSRNHSVRLHARARGHTRSDSGIAGLRILASEFQELVDAPTETLDTEYKSWLDLSENVARADLARHIAALANHGGGAIVFGFDNTLNYAGPNPHAAIDRDVVAGIVKKYLEPPFQCDVRPIKSVAGNEHPVIVVPPHGAAPVCAKSGGPLVDGKPKGIVLGVHYTRKPGPASEGVLTAAEWAPIIRRCAMHERSAILAAVDAALRGSGPSLPSAADALKRWHDAARAVFLKDIPERKAAPELARRCLQFSYAIERTNGEKLEPHNLIEVLREVNGEVRDLVRTGWSMFYIFSRREIEPISTTDPASGLGDEDFLECAHLRDPNPVVGAEDMWRVAADGKATLLRGYIEDRPDLNASLRTKPGTWISPNWMVRDAAEFIRHARGVAERFSSATAVAFRCEWSGLDGRQFYDPEALWRSDRVARGDTRSVARTWPVSALVNSWPEVVTDLVAPVIRLFTNDFVMTPDWVRGQAPKWLRP